MPLEDADIAKVGEIIAAALATNNTEIAKQFLSPDAASKMVEQGIASGLAGLDIGGQITSGIEGLGIGEQITTAIAALKPPEKKEPAGGHPRVDPAMEKLKEQQTLLEGQIREAKKAREVSEAKQLQQTLDGELRSAFVHHGVKPDRIEHIMAFSKTLKLKDGTPAISISKEGEMAFKHQAEHYVDPLSIKDGAAAYLATAGGKAFLPASGVNGDGQGAGKAPSGPSPSKVPRTADGTIDLGAVRRKLRDGMRGVRVVA